MACMDLEMLQLREREQEQQESFMDCGVAV